MNEVTRFMWFMFYKWDKGMACEIFGLDLGQHIWEKYLMATDVLLFYSELDMASKQRLVDKANEVYVNYYKTLQESWS